MNYSKQKWKRKRMYILKHYHYLDQELLRYGVRREADTVHHIFPVEYYPELAYVDWNLLPLSKDTHNKMHERNKGDNKFNLTDLGLEWQDRRKRKYKEWCKKNGRRPHWEN